MIFTNTKIACAALVIFISLGKGDRGEVETYSEDAEEILPGRTYYWKDWCFCQEGDYLYIWSESAVLRFWMKTTAGWIEFFTDGELFLQCPYGERRKKTNSEDVLEQVRSMINSTTHTQPILSHAGSNKIIIGNWFLISPKDREIIIQYKDKHPIITLREDFSGFIIETNDKKNHTFLPNTSLGAEFSTSRILGRSTNQLRSKAETLKPKVETENQNENNPDKALTVIQCNTDSRLHHISYIWNINNIDFHRPAESNNHTILSPTFSSAINDEIKWYLIIEPRKKDSNHIGVYLHLSRESKVSKIMAKYAIYFYDNQRHLVETYDQDLHIYYTEDTDKGYSSWGWRNIPFNELVSSDGKLHMVCNITFCESTNSTVSCGNRTDTNLNHKCELISEFIPTIENNEFPDIILILSKTGKEYPAHKAILASRSPVFAAMFKRRIEKGKKIKRINIKDTDEQVFDEILRYIYTGRCENTENLTNGLLVAALKYKLDGLKTICLEKLFKNITVENAVNTLILGDKHGFDELKSKAIRFIAANYPKVSNTSDWNQILKTNSKFVHEVCQMFSNYLGKKEIDVE